jgi:rhomboid protease GluP
MQLSPEMLKFLERLGVNTTRLKWKLYQLEQRKEQAKGSRLPTSLHWLKYRHKFCRHCGAVVDRDAEACDRCGRRVPSMSVYRLLRLLGLVSTQHSAPVVGVFLIAMVAVYLLSVMFQGPSALMAPSNRTLIYFGAWNPIAVHGNGEYWRMISFGLVHIGILHILFNGIALTQVGPLIELQAGPAKMLVLITLTQLTAAIATDIYYFRMADTSNPLYVVLLARTFTAGASGWLFGLLGFGIGYFHYVRAHEYRAFMIQWAVYGILFGILIGANNAAHVGGMLGGILMGLIPDQGRYEDRFWLPFWTTAAWFCGALWLITLAFMGHAIYTGWTTPH